MLLEKEILFKNNDVATQEAIVVYFKAKNIPAYEDISFPDNDYPYLLWDGNHLTQTHAKNKDIIETNVTDFLKHFSDTTTFKLNDDYTAVVNSRTKTITIGCQNIPFSKVNELYNLINQ